MEVQIHDGNEVLSRMWENLIESGAVPKRVDSTRIGLIFSAIASELNITLSLIESYLGQFTLQTCTDKVLVENMARLFVVRRFASKSKVVLTFTRDEGYDASVKIPANFAVQCVTDSKIIFKTIQDVFLWKGNKSVSVLAYSIQSGSNYNVEANTLTRFQDNGFNSVISVTNREPAYGGYDDESIDDLRNRVSGFRYERNGTFEDIQRQLMNEGYPYDKWLLIPPEDEYGKYTICIDTDADSEFEDIKRLLSYRSVPGITQVFKKANRLYVDMYITIYTTGSADYTASEKEEIYELVNESIQRFFLYYCTIGQSVNIKNIIADLMNTLSSYMVTRIDMDFSDGITLNGSVLQVGQETRIYPNKILTTLKYEGDYINA